MAATCPLCPRAAEIAAALAVPGVSQRAAAEALGISKTSMLRHLGHGAPTTVPDTVPPTVSPTIPGTVSPTVSGTVHPTVQPVSPAPVAPVAAPLPVVAPAVQAATTAPVQAAAGGLAAWGAEFAQAKAVVRAGKVGHPCGPCASPKRADIDKAIARGLSYRAIEKLHGINDTSIRRHAMICVPQCLQEAADRRAAADATTAATVAEEVDRLLATAKEQLTTATADGSHGERATWFRELRQTVELLAKLRGELGADIEIRIQASKQWHEIKAVIIAALTPHPAALAAVVAAIQGAE
jgi:hypothetical protein